MLSAYERSVTMMILFSFFLVFLLTIEDFIFLISMLIPGITDQGLYRIVGVGSKVQNLLLQCIERKKAKTVDLADQECEWEVKTITSALKQYLR